MSDKKVILVIDDDPDILDSIKAILGANGFEVETAMSGKEGTEKVKSVNPDLVLCDMMMERIDAGTKVAQDIRKNNPDMPVFLLSSIGSATATNIDIDKLGFSGVFQKPVDPDNLINVVKDALGM
ncbi:MAG TPA: response regulator [Spirochaetota bacterium]|nr:response regulator [Spirochaetota bacterium]